MACMPGTLGDCSVTRMRRMGTVLMVVVAVF
jgi:hypothetical protein